MADQEVDVLAIGAGPANLSLAAIHSGMESRQARGDSARAPRMFQTKPARPKTLHGSWWVFAAVACAACAALGVAIWISAQLHVDPALRNAALFVHLASLVLGFGAVLVADYFVVLWLVKRSTFAEAIHSAGRLHLPIWVGLIGLVLSGVLLAPDLTAVMTRAKLALVMVLTLNGLQAMILSKRMEASTDALSVRLLAWGAVTAAISQGCWWGAMWIGFWTAATGPGVT